MQSTGFYYVLGGVDYDLIPKDTVFEFSEENGVKEMPKMAYPRYRCATASLRGRVLVMGGYSTTGITQAVEILDIA